MWSFHAKPFSGKSSGKVVADMKKYQKYFTLLQPLQQLLYYFHQLTMIQEGGVFGAVKSRKIRKLLLCYGSSAKSSNIKSTTSVTTSVA